MVILVILSAAALSFFITMFPDGHDDPVAVVTRHGVEIYRIELQELEDRKELEIYEKYRNLIVAEKGRICFMEADCPDRVCVNTGWISRPGQVAVCLPAGVVIKITGQENDQVDIYLR